MDKYTGIFNTSGDVRDAVDAGSLHRPYMAIVLEPDQYIDWNGSSPVPPTPPVPPEPAYSAMPLTFEIISGGTIKWVLLKYSGDATATIQYKLNNGNWTNVTAAKSASATEIQVSAGDIIQFRGNNSQYSVGDRDYCHFRCTAHYNAMGNVMSLINSTNYENLTQLQSAYAFASIFCDNKGIETAENLVLPATSLTENCYYHMFSGCTNLTVGPELLAKTLKTSSYEGMFSECSNLSYVKCLATNMLATNCTTNWLSNVASTGTFVKKPGAVWSTGANGIPSGWTVVNADI